LQQTGCGIQLQCSQVSDSQFTILL
jgi:hypothetical protein